MKADRLLHVVFDDDDHQHHADFVRGLHAPDAGRVVCHLLPDGRNRDRVAHTVLTALGKEETFAGHGRNGNEAFERAVAWCIADGVEHLFVSRAHLGGSELWRHFIELAVRCGLDLWLIVVPGEGFRRAERRVLREWAFQESAFEEFAERWTGKRSDAAATAHAEAEGDSFPRVPASDFVTFLADCRDMLTTKQLRRVEQDLDEALEATLDWLANATSPSELDVAAHLRSLISDCPSIDQAVTRLRGAQVAFFHSHGLLKVDCRRVAAGHRVAIQPEHAARLLRRFSNTKYAAAAALAVATDLGPEPLAALRVSDVDGDTVSANEVQCVIPPALAAIVESHRVFRTLQAADAHEPLFPRDAPSDKKPQAMTARAMKTALRKVASDTGLAIWIEWNTKQEVAERRWAHRRGVSLQWL
jgi:hypothetical protein